MLLFRRKLDDSQLTPGIDSVDIRHRKLRGWNVTSYVTSLVWIFLASLLLFMYAAALLAPRLADGSPSGSKCITRSGSLTAPHRSGKNIPAPNYEDASLKSSIHAFICAGATKITSYLFDSAKESFYIASSNCCCGNLWPLLPSGAPSYAAVLTRLFLGKNRRSPNHRLAAFQASAF